MVNNPPADAGDSTDADSIPGPWKRKWQPTPVFLPGKPHGQRSLAGYSSEDHKELFTTEHTHRAEYIRGHASVHESSGSV